MVYQRWPRGLRYIHCDSSGADVCYIYPEDDETLEARFFGIGVFSDRRVFFRAIFWVVIWVLVVVKVYGPRIFFVDERGGVCQLFCANLETIELGDNFLMQPHMIS